MKISLKKKPEEEKRLESLREQHDFLDKAKEFPLPPFFDEKEIATYWVQKEHMTDKKKKKQNSQSETYQNINYIDQSISSGNTRRYM